MLKIYEDIINEVIKYLEADGESVNLSRSMIAELKCDWTEKLAEYTEKEWAGDNMSIDMHMQRFPGYDGLRGRQRGLAEEAKETQPALFDEDEGFVSDASSSEDLEKIENKNSNYMICLYVKVNRTKNVWKCSFKQGFINIGNVDIAFSSANGELRW
jgi:hypothetical protein